MMYEQEKVVNYKVLFLLTELFKLNSLHCCVTKCFIGNLRNYLVFNLLAIKYCSFEIFTAHLPSMLRNVNETS